MCVLLAYYLRYQAIFYICPSLHHVAYHLWCVLCIITQQPQNKSVKYYFRLRTEFKEIMAIVHRVHYR